MNTEQYKIVKESLKTFKDSIERANLSPHEKTNIQSRINEIESLIYIWLED